MNVINKESERIDGSIGKLLEENFNCSLLADIHHYKMIVYPGFSINNKSYRVARNGDIGYGIVDASGIRIYWKKDGRYYN